MKRRTKPTVKIRKAVQRAAAFEIERLERRALLTVSTSASAESSIDPTYVGGVLGINIPSDNSFRTDALFVDARKTFDAWSYVNTDGTPLSGADVSAAGYPTGTSATQGAYTLSQMQGYPDGVYTMSFQGAGTITVSGSGSVLAGSTTTTTVNGVTTTTALVSLEKDTGGDLQISANNFTTTSPLSNFHLMMPGYPVNTTQVYNPSAIARLKTFNLIRYMDLFDVNNSTLANWSARPLPTDFTATTDNGISYEDAIALANETGDNVWWNIPIDATDAFVTNLANLMKYGSDANGNAYTSAQANPVYPPLNPTLKVHIELGNELFNTDTYSVNSNKTQAAANVSAGILDGSQANTAGEQELYRLRQIRDDYAGVYDTSATDLSSHIGFVFEGNFASLTGAATTFDTGAINFSQENNGLTGDQNPANWGPLNSWLEAFATSDYHGLVNEQPTTLDQVFSDLNADFDQYAKTEMANMTAFVDQAAVNLPLWAYEGGVALTATTSAQLTLYTQASSDPRMDTFEQKMLDTWYGNGGSLFNQYSYIDNYNYFGSWGLLTYNDQSGNNKYDGIIKRLVPMGDDTLDGSVDFNDFLVLKSNYGQTGEWWQDGDFNGDGTVNLADLQILEAHINTTAFTAAQTAEYNAFVAYATNGTASSTIGSGLHAVYYSDTGFQTPVTSRTDPLIDFSWPQGGAGPATGVSQNQFSAQWTGYFEAPTSEVYNFHTFSDDGVEMYVTVNGVKTAVINDLTSGSHEDVGSIALQAGQKYAIELDYFQMYGNAYVKFQYQTPTIPLQDVPTALLFPATTPVAPTGVTATGVAGGVTITIPNVMGATSYNVYRSITPGGEGTVAYLSNIAATGSAVSVTDNSVTTGRTYYYTVTAVNSTGEGVQSAEVSAAALAPAGSPANAPAVTATGGLNGIALSWAAVTGATSYSIYRGTTAGAEAATALISGVTAVSYTDHTVLPGTKYYYTVVATNASGSTAFSNEVSANATAAAASPLTDADIGSPGQIGSASYNTTTGTYTVNGGGADIYGVGDQFNYDYTTVQGDQTLIARVATETATDYSTKSGLMFRQSTDSADAYADVLVTPGQGVVFEYRDTHNGTYSSTAISGVTAPSWIKLTRVGNTFTGYYSSDGINWSTVGSQTLIMNSTALAGLAVCAHNNSLLATATFTNVVLGKAPVVTTAPAAVVASAGTTAALSVAAVEQPASTLTYTWSTVTMPTGATAPTFSASNGTTTGKATTATFSKVGTYSFDVTITDASGNYIVIPLNVTISPVLTSIAITPASLTSVSPNSVSTFTAVANDQFAAALATQPAITWSLDTGSVGSINATTGAYTAPAAAGSATVRATSGTVSATAAVTVGTAADTTPPTVPGTPTLTSSSSTSVTIGWTASTDNVAVDHYVIYRGSVQIGTSTVNSYTDSTVSAGTAYSYTVSAVDAAKNASAQSGALPVTTPAVATQLAGTVIGTSGSYDGASTDTIAAVFDGSTSTYFDAPAANANNATVGLDLGIATPLTSISFAPRATFESRMVGGYFQGSNTADFSTATTLYTVTAAPADGYTSVNVTGTYRFVRYVAPTGSYGNIAEIKVFGYATTDTQAPTVPGTPTLVSATATSSTFTWVASTDNVAVDHYVIYRNGTKIGTSTTNTYTDAGPLASNTAYSYTVSAVDLAGNASAQSGPLAVKTLSAPLTGTPFGTSGSYDGATNDTIAAVFDGSTSTYFDAPAANASGAIIGLDLGSQYTLSSISFAPRVGFESRMVGGVFQGSNSSSFTSPTTLYTVASQPADGYTTVAVSGSYRYVRYVAPATSYGNVAEIQIYGSAAVADTQAPTVPGTPTLTSATSSAVTIGWTASTDNVGVDHYVIYRGGVQIGTSTTNAFTDSTVTGSKSYSYTVSAVDAAANASAQSAALVVTTPAGASQLTGNVFGTSGSYDGGTNDTIAAVFDGSLTTYFDAPAANINNAVMGLDLGTQSTLSSISFAPRVGFESRMVGGVFQGSNTASFTSATTLYTVTTAPPDGYTSVPVSGSFRYVRYVAPSGSYGNIAEVKIFGQAVTDTQAPTVPGTPTLVNKTTSSVQIAWAASTDNIAVDHYAIYRNGSLIGTSTTNSYTDAGPLAPGTAYTYTVAALDYAGNASAQSGPLSVTTLSTPLTGTVFGTAGSYDGGTTDTIAAVFDGSLTTYFDAPAANANNATVALNLGSAYTLSSISFAPRVGFESRMVGGYFQGSNTADFSNVTTLYTITTAPADGLNNVAVTGSFQYVRYVAPSGSYGNVAEIQLFGSH